MSSAELIYTVLEVTENFVRGRLDLKDTAILHDSIRKEVKNQDLQFGLTGDIEEEEEADVDARSSSIYWLVKSKRARNMALHLAHAINDEYFHLDIDKGHPPDVQFTVYQDYEDHYDWHQDQYTDDDYDGFKRNLSFSICLSPTDFYEGAEFFIKDGNERNVRVFKMQYGEFIFFPSNVEHKVNALRSGARESLVIWYGLLDE